MSTRARVAAFATTAGPSALALASALALLACATPRPTTLEVELLRGARALPAAAAPAPESVTLLVDLTPSMQVGSRGTERADLAVAGAEQLLTALPPGVAVDLWVLGAASQPPCGPAYPLAADPGGDPRAGLRRKLGAARTRSEVSVADTLGAVRAARDPGRPAGRVVLLSDLDPSCGGSLCSAAEALVADGYELHVMALGDAEPPACLDGLVPPPRSALASIAPSPGAGVPYQVYAAGAATAGGDASTETTGDVLLAEGATGTGGVPVPPGRVRVVLGLDDPLEIGPLDVAAGSATRVRVVDFPAFEPPVREWSVESSPVTPGGAETAP